MVDGPVDFVGEYALNFAWKGRKKMFDLLGVRSHLKFMELITSKDGTSNDMYEKIVYAGLLTKHPELKLEHGENDPDGAVYIEDLIERFFLEGKTQRQFDEIIEDALIVAGLLNKEQILFGRKMRLVRNRDDIKKLLDLLDKTFADVETANSGATDAEVNTITSETSDPGDDTGESPGNLQPTSTT